ncbi:MAG: SDR family oxidoreductase [Candidatus Tectomicrobia bacterium]|uniref:SDR family oxidoreductase n=1 Tax=Tectimicrobiota bacterium TaxID=2528274 RepID=A0A932I0P6_UNCTE|nr:SDR family oxidoreductase [Candidatus Tectomicrobia bacterium]
MDLGLKGKRAIVTGASRGIGRCCALALAKEGARVCVTARDEKLLGDVAKEVNAAGGEGMPVPADLTSLDGCKKVVDSAVSKFGGVDILINSAGAARGGDILDLPVDIIEEALLLKSFGYLRLSQLAIPHMKKQRWGRIVNIAGGAGASPARGNIPTSLANIAVLNMTRALSDAAAPDGIMVNTICPGMTNTQRARDLLQAQAKKEGKNVEEILAAVGKRTPAGRICEPEEVANVAAFLASDVCTYVFGSSIYMDGGGRRGTP